MERCAARTPPALRPHHHAAAAAGDTSSDEIVGHMFVLPIVHDLVAKTDEERAMARDLMCSNIDYIVDNGFTLVDADGNVTTWGHWCSSLAFAARVAAAPPSRHFAFREPEDVNMNYFNYDSRGLNSLQILSWLQSARRLCDPSPSSKCVSRVCVCRRPLHCSRISCHGDNVRVSQVCEGAAVPGRRAPVSCAKPSPPARITHAAHRYDVNVLNAKIEDPYDTNYRQAPAEPRRCTHRAPANTPPPPPVSATTSSCSCRTSPGPSRLHSSPSTPSAAPPSSPPSSARAPPEPLRTPAFSNYCSGNDTWFRFAFVQPDRSSLWCIISALTGGAQRDESLNDCIGYNLKVTPHCLCGCPCRLISAQRAPMELISWPYKNSARHDMCACSPALCLTAVIMLRQQQRPHALQMAQMDHRPLRPPQPSR